MGTALLGTIPLVPALRCVEVSPEMLSHSGTQALCHHGSNPWFLLPFQEPGAAPLSDTTHYKAVPILSSLLSFVPRVSLSAVTLPQAGIHRETQIRRRGQQRCTPCPHRWRPKPARGCSCPPLHAATSPFSPQHFPKAKADGAGGPCAPSPAPRVPQALTACRLCTTGSRQRGRRRPHTAGCPSAPPAPRCSSRPRCTAGLRGRRELGVGASHPSPLTPFFSPCSRRKNHLRAHAQLLLLSHFFSQGFWQGDPKHILAPLELPGSLAPDSSQCQCPAAQGVAREEFGRVFSSASEHQQCCFLPCSFFFRNKKMPIYCSLLSSPRRLSAQHLTMGGKPRLKETAEEEVEKKKKSLKKGEEKAKTPPAQKPATASLGSGAKGRVCPA